MKVIDRKKEQELKIEAAGQVYTQNQREQQQNHIAVIEQTVSIEIDMGAFGQLQQSMINGGLTRVYGKELTRGGYHFLPDQVEVAQQFFKLSLRDRNQINELIVEEYTPNLRDSIKLSFMTDREFVSELNREASDLSVDYRSYLRAIFYTTLHDINTEQLAIKDEMYRASIHDIPQKIPVLITKAVRDKLVEKYGKPVHNYQLNITTYSYPDMLREHIEETLGLTKPVRKK